MKTRRRNSTGANRGNGGRNQNLCSLRSLLFKSGPGGVVELHFDKSISDGVNMNPERFRGDFVFLACRAKVRRRRALHSLGDGAREYKAVYVQSDAEIGLFSDEVGVNCAP